MCFCRVQSDQALQQQEIPQSMNLVLITHFCSPSSFLSEPRRPIPSLTDLGFAFGDVVDPRSPEEEVALLPRLLPVLLQPQDALDLRHRHRAAAETLLNKKKKFTFDPPRCVKKTHLCLCMISPLIKPPYSCQPFPMSPSAPANSSGDDWEEQWREGRGGSPRLMLNKLFTFTRFKALTYFRLSYTNTLPYSLPGSLGRAGTQHA